MVRILLPPAASQVRTRAGVRALILILDNHEFFRQVGVALTTVIPRKRTGLIAAIVGWAVALALMPPTQGCADRRVSQRANAGVRRWASTQTMRAAASARPVHCELSPRGPASYLSLHQESRNAVCSRIAERRGVLSS
jgi:hypothetical protein